ncbi:MAG: hypothetical protein JSU87_14360 [Gemmatimonadota bacterium]|nr:MAG: hypothetical protein JSU87_14360 [Gemmatimonadota bacterium]
MLDSVPVGQTTGSGTVRSVNGVQVTCATGASHCYYYRSGEKSQTLPAYLDLDLNVFGLGVEGLRFYASTRFRGALGTSSDKFWPRTEDNFDLLAGYAELNRNSFRIRLGRDWMAGGLGWYGYDGGSVLYRYRPARLELEAYGGWGLERGLPERVTSSSLETLGNFQPIKDNYLYGFRGSFGPLSGVSAQAIYQREILTDRSGISSERVGVEANYRTADNRWLVEGHADYDLAAGWWGKAGAKVGLWANTQVYFEGRFFRYRPVFSLQTIWVAFSPVGYTGWGGAVGLGPFENVTARLEVERRSYDDTEADVNFYDTTDRTWTARATARWQSRGKLDVQGAYWIDWGYGSGESAGNLRLGYEVNPDLSVGLKGGALQQIWEYRIGEGWIYNIGADARWRTPVGTLFGAVDGFKHNQKNNAAREDWTQWRAALGISYYLGSEPGRRP